VDGALGPPDAYPVGIEQQTARALVAKHVGVSEDELLYEWHGGPGFTFRQEGSGVRHTLHVVLNSTEPVIISHE
jgi:hypothetical protein